VLAADPTGQHDAQAKFIGLPGDLSDQFAIGHVGKFAALVRQGARREMRMAIGRSRLGYGIAPIGVGVLVSHDA
jgi:hypothetical protein